MLVATFHLQHEGFALEQAFEQVPDMVLEAERIAAHSTEWTMPCIWIAAEDFEAVDAALKGDPTVTAITEASEYGGEKYYHIDWTDDVDEQITHFIDKKGSILRARATVDGWQLQMRFASRDQFDAFRKMLRDDGRPFELLELFEPSSPRQTAANVTPAQRDALVCAVQLGYFNVPREISMRELADELGNSHQSISELLRRGTGNLVTSTLITDRSTN